MVNNSDAWYVVTCRKQLLCSFWPLWTRARSVHRCTHGHVHTHICTEYTQISHTYTYTYMHSQTHMHSQHIHTRVHMHAHAHSLTSYGILSVHRDKLQLSLSWRCLVFVSASWLPWWDLSTVISCKISSWKTLVKMKACHPENTLEKKYRIAGQARGCSFIFCLLVFCPGLSTEHRACSVSIQPHNFTLFCALHFEKGLYVILAGLEHSILLPQPCE